MWTSKALEPTHDDDIYSLANHLPESSRVRRMALKHLCGISFPANAAETLLKIIAAPCWLNCKEQELAAILLERLSLDQEAVTNNAIFALAKASIANSHLGDHFVNRTIARAVPPILAVLTPDHYGRLSDETVSSLCKMLGHPDEEMIVRILEALKKVGNGQAVSAVEPLVTLGKTAAIRAAAERTLPVLKERQQRENEQSILLRASCAPAEAPNELLRPAMHGATSKPETLLRASSEPKART